MCVFMYVYEGVNLGEEVWGWVEEQGVCGGGGGGGGIQQKSRIGHITQPAMTFNYLLYKIQSVCPNAL